MAGPVFKYRTSFIKPLHSHPLSTAVHLPIIHPGLFPFSFSHSLSLRLLPSDRLCPLIPLANSLHLYTFAINYAYSRPHHHLFSAAGPGRSPELRNLPVCSRARGRHPRQSCWDQVSPLLFPSSPSPLFLFLALPSSPLPRPRPPPSLPPPPTTVTTNRTGTRQNSNRRPSRAP